MVVGPQPAFTYCRQVPFTNRQGYERTTIRQVATDANIDPSMVMRYYGSKDGLFAAAVDDLELPDLSAVPTDEVAGSCAQACSARTCSGSR
jgi:hypothetical protein